MLSTCIAIWKVWAIGAALIVTMMTTKLRRQPQPHITTMSVMERFIMKKKMVTSILFVVPTMNSAFTRS